MKFFEPNEKRNTVAAYVFLVALFAVLCVIIGINIAVVGKVFAFIFEVVKPLIYGFAIAFLMHPIVRLIETRVLGNRKEKKIGFRHFLSVVIAYVVVISLILLFCVTAIPQIASNYNLFTDKFFEYIDNFRNGTADFVNANSSVESIYIYTDTDPCLRSDVADGLFSTTLRGFDGVLYSVKSSSGIQEVRDIFDKTLTHIAEMISSSLPNLFSSAVTVLTEAKNLIIGIFLSLYILLGERKHIKRITYVLKAWLPKKTYTRVAWVAEKAKNIFRDYIIVRLLDGLIIGVLMYICLFIFQIPYDFEVLLAVIMGVASFFPFIGPVIGIAAGTFILLLVDPKYALLYLIISVVLNLLDSRYVEPILNSGRGEHTLPAIWVFAAIVIMGGFFGVVGILLGIPLFAFIYAIIKELCGKRLRAISLSDDTRDYFVPENQNTKQDEASTEDEMDMRDYYDERRETETEIADNAKKKLSKLAKVFKRKKKSSSDEEVPPEDKTE